MSAVVTSTRRPAPPKSRLPDEFLLTVPDRRTNAAFGDADGRTLYITGQGVVYRVRLANPRLLAAPEG
jgi:hypothetical protein